MATENLTFTGKAHYCKFRDEYPPEKFNYVIQMEVDDDNLKKFVMSGIRTKVGKSEEGNPTIKLKRALDHKINSKGEEFGGGYPVVFMPDGSEADPEMLIGNGSELEVDVAVYNTKHGKGQRIEAVRISKFVPYEEVKREQSEEPSVATTPKPKVKIPF